MELTKEIAISAVKKTIAEHFPELKGLSIKIEFVKNKDYYLACGWFFFHYKLFIDASILKYSEQAFIGCTAHELSHLVDLKQSNVFSRFIKMRKNDETIEERKADQAVIDRGLGKQLLHFHKEHNEDHKSYKPSEGLTKKEIKKQIKDNKKIR